jgi:hypothetical protein
VAVAASPSSPSRRCAVPRHPVRIRAAGAHPKQIRELCRHRSITTTLNEYGGLFESLHDELADRLDEARKASATGRMRDQHGTNVIALPAAAGEQGH